MQNKIKAFINPFTMAVVNDSLKELGIEEQVISNVNKFALGQGHSFIFRMKKQVTNFQHKVMIEMIVEPELTQKVIVTLQKAHRTKMLEDCKVFVLPVEKAIWI
jgi:nitrogen regulatory protein PII